MRRRRSSAARHSRDSDVAEAGDWTPARTIEVDAPRRQVDRASVARPGSALFCRRRRPGATRSPRSCSAGTRCAVVHAQQLRDERLADPLEVAQRQVALVELAVLEPLVDDARSTIARIAGSSRVAQRPDRRLDAVGQHQDRRLPGSAAWGRRGGTGAASTVAAAASAAASSGRAPPYGQPPAPGRARRSSSSAPCRGAAG